MYSHAQCEYKKTKQSALVSVLFSYLFLMVHGYNTILNSDMTNTLHRRHQSFLLDTQTSMFYMFLFVLPGEAQEDNNSALIKLLSEALSPLHAEVIPSLSTLAVLILMRGEDQRTCCVDFDEGGKPEDLEKHLWHEREQHIEQTHIGHIIHFSIIYIALLRKVQLFQA